jgi:gliding motility-associated-like protein
MPNYLRFFCLFLLLARFNAAAQQCAGPAEPVAVINFGTEANPYSIVGKAGKNYTIATENCTPENSIAVRERAFLCKPEWQLVPGDHTRGDEKGNFLMVSAVEGNAEFFRDTVSGLCPGSPFFLEAAIINMMRSAACDGNSGKPELVFVLTDLAGNKIMEGATGAIPTNNFAEWVAARFQFVSPSDGSVILHISNQNGVSCGSDFGVDDISFAPCSRAFTTSVQGVGTEMVKVCQEGQKPYVLQANVNGFNNPALQWQVNKNDSGWQDVAGATGAAYLRRPTEWGNFKYRLKLVENGNRGCSFISEPSEFLIYPQPFAQGTNYVFGCYGSPFKFQGAGGSEYVWSGPAGFRSTDQAPVLPKLEFHHSGLYLVKVTTSLGCVGYDSTDLVVFEAPVGKINNQDTAVCIGESVQLKAEGAKHYLWQPATGLSSDTVSNPVARPQQTTSYMVTIFNEGTCYDTAKVTIQVLPRPTAAAGPDQYVLKNRTVQLRGQVSGDDALTFRWTPADKLNNANSLRPQAKLSETTRFRLEVNAGNGCGNAYDEVNIEVVNGLFIPTAFTPNGDFLNDVWEIVGIEDYPAAVVRLFNRWGTEVYHSTGSSYKPWKGIYKGSAATPGIYIFVLDLGNGSAVRKGTVTILK